MVVFESIDAAFTLLKVGGTQHWHLGMAAFRSPDVFAISATIYSREKFATVKEFAVPSCKDCVTGWYHARQNELWSVLSGKGHPFI